MATETFTWLRQAGASGTIKNRVTTAQFGDGYKQSITVGLNSETQSWPLSFEGSLTEMRAIYDFLKRHKGSKSFYWTPPTSDVPLYFNAAELTFVSVGGGVYQVNVTFEQVFYP